MKIATLGTNEIVARLVVAGLFAALLFTVGMALNSANLIQLWARALATATTFLLFSPIRYVRPLETVPQRLEGLRDVVVEDFAPDFAKRAGIALGAFRTIVALVVAVIAVLLMMAVETALAGLGGAWGFVAGLLALAVALGVAWFVIIYLLQATASDRTIRFNRALYNALPASMQEAPAVAGMLNRAPSRSVNAATVAVIRTSAAVLLQLVLQLIIPSISPWWIAALSIVGALLIVAPDLIVAGLRAVSSDKKAGIDVAAPAPSATERIVPTAPQPQPVCEAPVVPQPEYVHEAPVPATPSAPATTTPKASWWDEPDEEVQL